MNLTELFCHVDDFWMAFAPQWQANQLRDGERQRQRKGQLCESEIMTLLIYFHQARYRDFKTYYTRYVQVHLQREFPQLVSYGRFVQWIPKVLVALCAYLYYCFGQCTGISLIDSTPLAVSHNRRIAQHKTFAGIAQRGKNSVDWFFGFKLHLVVNDCGELLACCLTTGNTDDRRPVPKLVRRLFGKLFGDKGYLSQALFEQLWEQGVQLVTKLKTNMKNRLMDMTDKLLQRQRAVMETIIDQLKNISQIEHTRHRSFANFCVNLVCGLIAYSHQPKKPSLHLVGDTEFAILIHY
jgi:Transposase DDE domain